MFRIYFTNHGYYSERQFIDLTEALSHAKSCHFQAYIHQRDARGVDHLVASWCPLYGTRFYS